MRDAASKSGLTAMVAHEFRHTPQRAYIKQLLADGYIGKFQLCTIELFLDRYVTPSAAPAELDGEQRRRRRPARCARLALHRWPARLVRRCCDGQRAPGGLAARCRRYGDGRIVKAESDDTFLFTLTFRNGGIATMIASFAATPSRGTRIVVMGDGGTLIAEQPGPNPMEDGVVIASRNGEPLACARDARTIHAVQGPARSPADGVPAAGPRFHRRRRTGMRRRRRISPTGCAVRRLSTRCENRPSRGARSPWMVRDD